METRYSGIAESFETLKQDVADRALLRPVEPFSKKDSVPTATKKRIKRAMQDYWYFDEVYFAKEQYQEYAKSGEYHRQIYDEVMTPGVTIHAGPRDHGKTVTVKKIHIWLLLTGRTKMLGTLSYTATNSENILRDIASLIIDNDRIVHDFQPDFLDCNSEQFSFRLLSEHIKDRQVRYAAAFSERRSVRGYTRMFSRPDRLYGDDMETLSSPIGGEHTERRIRLLEESAGSLGGDNPTMFVTGNNFDARGYINSLVIEKEKGGLGDKSSWNISINRAWSANGALWPEKYPAQSEEEMQAMVRARNKSDFNANWQQTPTPAEGHTFKRQYQQFWEAYPKDARGVIYADQNLAMKSRGDTTAVVRYTYSPTTDAYYISARCRSYDDPNTLLDDILQMRTPRIRGIGFDGNVSQESHWRIHVRNWCRQNKAPYPTVQFCKYSVDDLATNFQMVFAEGRIYFDPAMANSEEGVRFFDQFFAFVSKKDKRKDDAPDAAICAHQFLTERKINRAGGVAGYSITAISEDE